MLRIVILLDSLKVSAWVLEAIFQTMQEKNARVVLAVVNQSPKSSGKKSPFLYRLYRALDRKLFLRQPDAFSQKELTNIPGWEIPVLPVQPIQKKYSDYLTPETLEEIRAYNPDIIIRFGFRILRGEILQLAPLGVWSFHHGDPQKYRGGPPCFWEVINKEETTGAALIQLSEKLDDGLVFYQSWSQTDPLSVQRNANKVFWNSSFFIARVFQEISVLGLTDWKQKLLDSQPKSERNIPILTPPNFPKMLSSWIGLWGRNFSRKISEGLKRPHWEITVAKLTNGEDILNQTFEFKPIKAPANFLSRGSFWADPFPIEHQGNTWVFYEEFDFPSKKGGIGVGIWDGNYLTETKIVVAENWHLSYPFVLEENGQHYLIPESGESKQLFIYRALEFPHKWEKLGMFFEGEAYDPTILKRDGLYWLFVNRRSHEGTSAFVELCCYYSSDLENPNWVSHALNPIVSDVRSSRPAGRIFEQDGKLYRPAQDSGKRYGHRIKIQEILKLNKFEYSEKTVRVIEGEEEKGVFGTHTFNFTSNWVFSDAYSRK
ncbi:MAG: formyltransferase family protein [Algoriphagus sp.]|nr:formyltransferase family protein [Algoriphagus sp.]